MQLSLFKSIYLGSALISARSEQLSDTKRDQANTLRKVIMKKETERPPAPSKGCLPLCFLPTLESLFSWGSGYEKIALASAKRIAPFSVPRSYCRNSSFLTKSFCRPVTSQVHLGFFYFSFFPWASLPSLCRQPPSCTERLRENSSRLCNANRTILHSQF